MKQGDIVGKVDDIWQAKVTWVDEEADQCGVVYTAPEDYRGGGQAYKISELKIIGRATPKEMKHIDHMTVEELRAEVQKLRDQPRRAVGIRKKVRTEQQVMAEKLKGLTMGQIEKLMGGKK